MNKTQEILELGVKAQFLADCMGKSNQTIRNWEKERNFPTKIEQAKLEQIYEDLLKIKEG